MVLSSLALVAAVTPLQFHNTPFTIVLGDDVGAVLGAERQVFSDALAWWPSPRAQWILALTNATLGGVPGRVMPGAAGFGETWLVAAPVGGGQPWRAMKVAADTFPPKVVWSADGKVALVAFAPTVRDPNATEWTEEVVLLDPAAKSLRPLGRWHCSRASMTSFGDYPGMPILVKFTRNQQGMGPTQVGVLDAKRALVWMDFPEGRYDPYSVEWAMDAGRRPVAFVPGTDLRYVFDAGPGTVKEVRGDVALYAPPAIAQGLQFVIRTHALTNQGTSASVPSLWLESEGEAPERALATPQAEEFLVAEDWTWLAYRRHAGVYVRAVELLDARLVRQMREAAERTEQLMKVKQVGTAIMIFMADSDDKLPDAAGFREKILPYLKNESMLEGFVYLMDGQFVSDFDSPAKTELGYAPIKGGRAVVYLDGHAKIIYDRPGR
jgi:hypothetical protein